LSGPLEFSRELALAATWPAEPGRRFFKDSMAPMAVIHLRGLGHEHWSIVQIGVTWNV